jgi:ferric-dicitrate binding protein FerR (iron transport regulator)
MCVCFDKSTSLLSLLSELAPPSSMSCASVDAVSGAGATGDALSSSDTDGHLATDASLNELERRRCCLVPLAAAAAVVSVVAVVVVVDAVVVGAARRGGAGEFEICESSSGSKMTLPPSVTSLRPLLSETTA